MINYKPSSTVKAEKDNIDLNIQQSQVNKINGLISLSIKAERINNEAQQSKATQKCQNVIIWESFSE